MKFNRNNIIKLFLISFFLILEISCSSTDCPLNNVVRAYYTIYSSSTREKQTITDTLSITAADSVVLNKAINISSFNLPMSYGLSEDTLYFKFASSKASATDTVFIAHTNIPHFVSLDCGTAIFHKITGIHWTKRTPTENLPIAIDSIFVSKSDVNYDQTENFKVYLNNY